MDAPEISPEALTAMRGYPFLGNVRELENILERALTLCEGNRIEPANLGLLEVTDTDTAVGPTDLGASLDTLLVSVEKDTILKALEQTRWNKTAAAKFLGISFGALRYRMQKLGLE
jgi:two-component system response regulator PilR (NtrC family)